MGAGLAKEFKNRYRFTAMFEKYKKICQDGLRFGQLTGYLPESTNEVLFFPTKIHWKDCSNLKNIESGLHVFRHAYGFCNPNKSYAFPALGCGCGGLDWNDVAPLMFKYLYGVKVDIEIYEPTK
jgi:hypothetical protein